MALTISGDAPNFSSASATTISATTITGVTTLNASSGVLATQNGMTGIAKAWVNFSGTTGAVNGGFNVSSVTVNGTGDYTVNYTTAMPSASYAVALQSTAASGFSVQGVYDTTTTLTTSIRIQNRNLSSSLQNPAWMSVTINGA